MACLLTRARLGMVTRGAARGAGAFLRACTTESGSVLPEPTVSMSQLLTADSSEAVEVTDAQCLHIAALSYLRFEPGTPAFAQIKADLSNMLTLMKRVEREAAALGPAAVTNTPTQDTPSVDMEAEAARRIATLRRDVAAPPLTDAQIEQVLQYAPSRSGAYIAVPKVLISGGS